jgi:iron complex outermembrane receptor protein
MFRIIRTTSMARALTLGIAFTFVAPAVWAADQPIETVVVTGTLLHREETASPVTVVSRDQIEATGLTSTADIIRSLAADSSGTIPTAFGNGFAAGSSGVALRGLTVNSTLVLINGRRTANYPLADDGERGFVDLNTIPLEVVNRVEVLKDGASSLYGADAIGGVVNIILDDTYQGAEGTVEGGTSQQGGGQMLRLTGTVGDGDLSSDRFNAYINFEYQQDQRVAVGDRDFPFNTCDLTAIGGVDSCGTTSIYGKVYPTMEATAGDITSGQGPFGPSAVLAPGGCGALGALKADGTNPFGGVYCKQNTTLYTDDQPAQERKGVYSKFTVQVNSHMHAFLDASYFQNTVNVDGTPPSIRTGSPINTNAIVLPALLPSGAVNPNDPYAVAGCIEGVNCLDAQIRYFFGDIKGASHYDNHVVRATVGVDGDWSGWTYDSAFVVAHSWLNSELDGFLNYDALHDAVVNGTYNFIDPSQNSADLRNTIAPALIKTSTTDMDSFDFRVSRDAFQLPGGTSEFGFGAEIRHEATFDPDLNPSNATQGLGAAHTIGNRNIYAAYAELGMPILTTLQADISGRFDHYSDFGNTFNPKFTLKWTPVPEIALRGTYSRGFRAPSFSENGSAASLGFITFTTPDNFQAQHGFDEYSTLPYALGIGSTANPNIRPETSDSFTGGTVLQPFGSNITATIDYYYIHKKNVIAPADTGTALDAYFGGQPVPPGYVIVLDVPDPNFPAAPPRPLIVQAPYINASSLVTNGLDFAITAGFELAPGLAWNTDLQETHILTYRYSPFPGLTYEYAGTQSPYITSSGAGTPRDRASWTNTFSYEAWSVSGTLYYVSGLKPVQLDACGAPVNCAYPVNLKGDGDSFWDFDLTARYQVNDRIMLFGGIDNLFDARPPVEPEDYAGTNYNPTYHQAGIIGRFFKLGVTYKTQ